VNEVLRIAMVSAERVPLAKVGGLADVVGALAAGARAVWFAPDGERPLPDRVRVANDASELACVLSSWGVSLTASPEDAKTPRAPGAAT